jgi:hypothetical protein
MENPEINLAIYGYKKVYLLDHANKVSKIFVFSGNSDARVENKKLFSDNELLTIKNDNTEIRVFHRVIEHGKGKTWCSLIASLSDSASVLQELQDADQTTQMTFQIE